MKILAFMQNAWFPPGTPQRIIDRYHDDSEFHIKVLSKTMSGRRLMKALGDELYKKIIWDNTTREVASQPSGNPGADLMYMRQRILAHKPDAIIAVGQVAYDAMIKMRKEDPVKHNFARILMPHPNKRGITSDELKEEARKVQEFADIFEMVRTIDE